MDAHEFKQVRKALGFTQQELADALGMSKAAVVNLEAGTAQVRTIHVLALKMVSLQRAVDLEKIDLAPPSVRKVALDYAALVRGPAVA